MNKIQLILSLFLFGFFVDTAFGLNDAFVGHLWNKFKKSHGKIYLSEEHETERLMIFKENVNKIEKHNSEFSMGMHTYTLGINIFADWTAQEFRHKLLGVRPNETRFKGGSTFTFMRLPVNVKIPDEVDWRKEKLVTDVKNQGECGSCWAFSTTGSLEGQHARVSGKLVALSEQQLVDCSQKYDNQGCNGGLMDNAFKYIQENGGLETEEAYPYKAKEGKCKFNKANVAATCTGYTDIPTGDEAALKEAVGTAGPVSVAIDVTEDKFMLYKDGVFTDDECTNGQDSLNHGVLVVGYGTNSSNTGLSDGQDYWIVKNSWGPSWGESGYIRMARNNNNMCGIATAASYPLVK